MKESKPIPAIAVSLATSLVAAPYLLIRNYYHKKVAPGLCTPRLSYVMGSRRLNFAANPSKQAEKALSPFLFYNNKVSFIAPTYTRPPLTKRWFYPGQATKAGNLGGNSERKRRGRSGVE